MIRFNQYSDFLAVVGRKGKGKTVFTIYIIKSIRRKIIIDPTFQMHNIPLGYVVHSADKIENAFTNFNSVVFQPKTMTDEEYTLAFDTCLKFTNYTLVVDEINKFARPRWYICESLNELINRGRAQGIGLICNSRRPHSFHNDIRSNVDYVVCFQLHEERDVKYMSEWLNVPPERIKNLPPYHSLLWSVDEHEVKEQLPCEVIT